MGRPPTLWLQRAYEVCLDGEWHRRDDVINEMMKTVPPGVAYRRGTMVKGSATATDRQIMERGARHLCLNSLTASTMIQTRTRHGQVFLRYTAPRKSPPMPLVLEPVNALQATHVVIPIDAYRSLCEHLAGVRFVREPVPSRRSER